MHIANLLMSMLSSGQFSIKVDASTVAGVERRMLAMGIVGRMVDAQGRYAPNPCSFYLLNLAIDVSLLSLSHVYDAVEDYILMGAWK